MHSDNENGWRLASTLRRLLGEEFSPEELAHLLQTVSPHHAEILRELPSYKHTAPMYYADDVVRALQQRALIDRGFLQALLNARPKCRTAVLEIATGFGETLVTPVASIGADRPPASSVGDAPHRTAVFTVHMSIIIVSGLLSITACAGGIYAISQAALSNSEFSALGVELKTGNVGVALVGLGLVIGYFTMKSVLKNQHDLARIHPQGPR